MLNQAPNAADISSYHRLDPRDPMLQHIINDPSVLGLSEADFTGMCDQQRVEFILGEYFALVAKNASVLAGQLLEHAQWGFQSAEWFDHRLHLLNSDRWFKDFWTYSADHTISLLPMGGRLLDLCSGDGFYDYYFYRRRASEIICLELNEIAYRYAVRLHSAPNIRHVNADVLHYEFPENYFDVVTIRGAIEHFTQENQQIIFQKALRALKPGGWFCGDTVANADKHFKMLEAHEFEWADEDEMRVELRRAFEHVETSTLVSQDRVTILWKCRKPERHVQSETPDVVFRW